MPRVSIKELAQMLELSPSTISFVLNGRGDEMRIAKETQQKILELAKKSGYKPNIYARRLRIQPSERAVIGILWPSIYSAELIVRFFDGIHKSILEEQINVEVVYKPYQYSQIHKVEEIFKNNIFHGVVVVGASDEDVDYMQEIQSSMPIVFFNRQNPKYSSVCVDDYNVGEMAAQLLFARGHKQVAYIEPKTTTRHTALRKAGFLDTFSKYGVNIKPENIIAKASDVEINKEQLIKLLTGADAPTAIFSTTSSIMPLLYEILYKFKISVPDDLELLGYADTPLCNLLNPKLSVLDMPVEAMVSQCLQLILDMINGHMQFHANVIVENDFIIRESCGGFPDK